MKVSIIKGQILMVVTSITKKDVELLQDVNPNALVLRDAKDNEIFRAAVSKDAASFTKHGIIIHEKKEFTREYDRPLTPEIVQAEYGAAFLKLQALEAQVTKAVADFKAATAAMKIEVID